MSNIDRKSANLRLIRCGISVRWRKFRNGSGGDRMAFTRAVQDLQTSAWGSIALREVLQPEVIGR